MGTKLVHVVTIIAIFLMSAACGKSPAEVPLTNTGLRYSVSRERYRVQFIGIPYEVAVDNCNGARDSTKIEERSQRYLTQLDIEVSNKVAAEFGGDIEVAKAILRDEIGIALGIRIGTETEARSSVEVVTPPGKRTVTTVQWKEIWIEGSIAIMRPDGSYIDVLPFAALNSLTLEQLNSQTRDCKSGEIVAEGAAQIITPEVPVIIPTPTPVSIGTISVPGNSSEGTRFTASQPGLYIFRYVRGAYSTYPPDRIPAGQATWLTAVRIFKNRPIEWNGVAISDLADYRAVDYGYFYSQHEAEARAEGQILTLSLLQGDYLILVSVDERPYYSDNPGEVVFEVLFIPER